MFKKFADFFKTEKKGMTKIRFIALNENNEPYEEVAQVPWNIEFNEEIVKNKFKAFMRLRGHDVIEISVLEVWTTEK